MRRADRPERDPAYDAFFTAHLNAAYRVCARVVGPGPAAEDLSVEAMARAFVHWPAVRRMDHPRAWVLRVATNLALDQVRRRQPAPGPAPLPDRTPEDVVQRDALVASLRRLPRRQQEVVVLRYIADLPEAEVAAALGISTGTVKSHLHRALPRLRAELGTPA